jgi:hypothetical protein
MCHLPINVLDYIASIVHEVKDDIFAERYHEAKAKVDAVTSLLDYLNERRPLK